MTNVKVVIVGHRLSAPARQWRTAESDFLLLPSGRFRCDRTGATLPEDIFHFFVDISKMPRYSATQSAPEWEIISPNELYSGLHLSWGRLRRIDEPTSRDHIPLLAVDHLMAKRRSEVRMVE